MSAFHAYALAVSQQSGVFYSDARRDGREFCASKNTISKWTQRLEKEGWFCRLDRGRRLRRNKRTGMYDSIRYEVLDHDTWATLHPGKCRFPESRSRSHKLGQAPVLVTESPVPISDSTGPNLGAPPVPRTGTKQEESKKRSQNAAANNHRRLSSQPTLSPSMENRTAKPKTKPRFAVIAVASSTCGLSKKG